MSTDQKIFFTPITDDDREDIRNLGHRAGLKLEVRERLKKEISQYLLKFVHLNVSEIIRQTNLSRQTIQGIVLEILDDWKGEAEAERQIQLKWYRNLLEQLETNPEIFDDAEKMKILSRKEAILRRINMLEGNEKMDVDSIGEGRDILFLKIFGSISSKTLKLLEEKTKENNEQPKSIEGNA